MKNIFKIIFIAIFATVSFSTLAADWTVIQSATITAATPNLRQGTGVVSNSVQAINGIALEIDADDLTRRSSQLADLTSLDLTQGPKVTGSSQAINYLEARNVGTGSGAVVTQTVTSGSVATTLTQTVDAAADGGGAGNVQAMNIGKSSGTDSDGGGVINNLNQVITEGGTLTLVQDEVATAKNVQAVNYAFGQTIGAGGDDKLEQATTVTDSTTFSQAATGSENRQGGNIAVTSDSGSVVAASQEFIARVEIGLTQNMATGDGNVQALNQVDTTANTTDGTVGTVSQTFQSAAGAGVTFDSNAGSETNVQAANLVDTRGSITALTQSFTATNSALVTFDMTGGGNGNIQAGNMARTAGDAIIAEITQTFTGSLGANTFNQDSSGDNLVQSGNLIDLGTGSISDTADPHQVFIAGMGSIAMIQLGVGGGTNNLQSLNAITGAAGTRATQAHQTISTTGAFTMSQNAMTSSRQFGSFAGEMQ